MSKIHVLHENDTWVDPLRRAFEDRGLPYAEWFLDEGLFDLSSPPPAGVFYNRMSASSHTRGHRFGPELAAMVLAWLESHGRRVVNPSRAVELEVSKAKQYAALNKAGIATPRTIAAVGGHHVLAAAERFAPAPFIVKPNRGGKGLGVELFRSVDALRERLADPAYEAPIDGISLVQEYIEPADTSIIRAEFVGGRFFYAVRVDTSQGFLLCPADACAPEGSVCPADSTRPGFEILLGFDHPILARYEDFLARNGIEIAGIEFITDCAGQVFTYDVNTNTNYNAEAERVAGLYGMREVARFLGAELKAEYGRVAPAVAAE